LGEINSSMMSSVLGKPVLDVCNTTLQYKTDASIVTATHDVSFSVYKGDRTILLGQSGCGKSTLLKAIGGFITPAQGEIRLHGRKVTSPGPDRMTVFQEFDQLMPWKTVLGNVLFPLVSTGMGKKEALTRAYEYLAKVNLTKFADAYPHTLSGGMKQRVAIARALALEPEILLMDEPFAALDALTRQRMQEELLVLWEAIGCTMIFVTHSIEEAIIVGSRIVVLSPHPGRIAAEYNCDHLSFGEIGTEAFASLKTRIERVIFSR
jgi:NitT/TauT family transport system ATP-binding protein